MRLTPVNGKILEVNGVINAVLLQSLGILYHDVEKFFFV